MRSTRFVPYRAPVARAKPAVLPRGGVVAYNAAAKGRGQDYNLVYIDEARHVKNEDWRALYAAMRKGEA